MSLPNPGMSFTPLDPLPAADLNDMVENIEALADGTGLDDASVTARAIESSAITLSYQQLNSNTAVTGTSYIDLSGLSVTVTVPAGGRYLEVVGYAPHVSTTSAENVVNLSLRDGSNNIVSGLSANIRADTIQPLGAVVYVRQLAAGTYTFKLSVSRSVNSGTTTVSSASTRPSFITARLM